MIKTCYIIITYFWCIHIPWCETKDLDTFHGINMYIEQKGFLERYLERSNLNNIVKREARELDFRVDRHVIQHNQSANALFFTLSQKQYLVINTDIFLLRWKENNFLLEESNIMLTGAMEQKIDFIRAIEYEEIGLLLVHFHNENIQLYDSMNNKVLDTLQIPSCIDAQFFEQNNNLYLIVVNNEEDNSTNTLIYKWENFHFVEIFKNFTIGAVKVTTFTTEKSEILIILQTHSTNKTIEIYKFETESIIAIQTLDVQDPLNLDLFKEHNDQFLIIYEKNLNNTVYRWNGTEFQQDYQILTDTELMNAMLLRINGRTIAVEQKQFHVELYQIYPPVDGLRLPIEYSSEIENVLDVVNDFNGSIYVIGLNVENDLLMERQAFSFKVEELPVVSDSNPDYLNECFNTLEGKIYDLRRLQDRNEIIDSGDAATESFPIVAEALKKDTTIDQQIEDLKNRIEQLSLSLDSRSENDRINLTITTPVEFKGKVIVDKISVKDLQLQSINGKTWTPENWLTYSSAQNITGHVKIDNVTVNQLKTSHDDQTFQDLIYKNGNNTFSGKIGAKTLTAQQIFVDKINGIDVEDIYLKNDLEVISGLKSFQNLNATTATINVLNEKNFTTSGGNQDLRFGRNITIENLQVETIDGVSWNEFRDSVFRASQTDTIIGNLKLPTLKTKNLYLKKLNGINVEDFLTATTDQTIKSNITFKRIFAEEIINNWTNGIDLKTSAALMNQNLSIKGPVTLEKMSVANNIDFIGEVNKTSWHRNGGRIIGTNESDLLQEYNRVTLKGNLYLHDLSLNQNATLFIGEEELPYNLTEIYWTKSTRQIIPVRVHILDHLTVSHLTTNTLNDVKFSQFMRNSNDQPFETDFIFDNITVFGNVILNNAAVHKPDLNKINKEAVKTSGNFMIHGTKTYRNTLRCEHLVVNELEGIKTLDTLKRSVPANITGELHFNNLIIKGNVNSSLNRLDTINGVGISEVLSHAILLDESQKINRLKFRHLKADNLQVTTIDHQPIEEFFNEQKKQKDIDRIENLIIDSDVIIKKAVNTSKINGIPFTKLVEKAGNDTNVIPYNLIFNGRVKLDNLIASFINGIDLVNLTSRLLYRELNQTITAPFSFRNIKANNIVTPKIKGTHMENLIDVSKQETQTIHALGGLKFADVEILDTIHVKETYPCSIEDIARSMSSPPTKKWSEMIINGNVTLLDPESPMYNIFENSVKKDEENYITAPVTFEGNVFVKNLESFPIIDNINISDILNDAVVADSTSKQIITGRKIYQRLEVQDAVVMKNTESVMVNDENITALNEDIVDKHNFKNSIVRGMKTFYRGLQVDKLNSKTIMNIDPENIVTIPSKKKIPTALFEQLEVTNNLNFSFVNNANFVHILETRLLLDSNETQICDGVYFFDNLKIKEMITPAIQDIKVANLVFDDGTVQNITGPKHFTNEVEILGNLDVGTINDIDVTEKLRGGIRSDERTVINGSITLLRPTTVYGNLDVDFINGFPVSNLSDILSKNLTMQEIQDIYKIEQELADKINSNWPAVESPIREYMYLEQSNDLKIPTENIYTASSITINDYVHIRLMGEEPGDQCGLPASCKCPFQNTLIISPEMSLSTFEEKVSQRIFTYDNKDLTVHFITNTVSRRPDCRVDALKIKNEVSMLTWNTAPSKNVTGRFHQYSGELTGYISKVEYFTFNNKLYIIVGRYYDPIQDTYDLNCTLLRFNEDKTNLDVIQNLETKGAEEIYLFYAVQGVRLIIGNTKENEEETHIYTFNPETEQFDLLRIVPYFGCSNALGIVIGADSLIALRRPYAPVQILKYYPEFNNYYHFQSFDLDEEVVGMSSIYAGGYGISDPYLCLVTAFHNYYIYTYRHMSGWKIVSHGLLEGVKGLFPVDIGHKKYIIALSAIQNSLMTVVRNGPI